MAARALYEKELADRIRSARQSAGYSQAEMAAILGISKDQFAKYENRSPMPAYFLARLALAVGADPGYLLTGKRAPQIISPPEFSKTRPTR